MQEDLLDLSNAVRASIGQDETFGSAGQRLTLFLKDAIEAEEEKKSTLSLETIRYARLDKLLEDICELGPSLRNRQIRRGHDMFFRMDEKYANKLQQAWRSRFQEHYWFMDDGRMKRLLNTLLSGVWFSWSPANGEGHWQTQSSTMLSDPEIRQQFEPG